MQAGHGGLTLISKDGEKGLEEAGAQGTRVDLETKLKREEGDG